MSGWIRKALFSNLSLKVVSLVLAVAIYVLVRPGHTGRSARPDRRPGAAAWRPDKGTSPRIAGSADAAGERPRRGPPGRSDAGVASAPSAAGRLAPSSLPAVLPKQAP